MLNMLNQIYDYAALLQSISFDFFCIELIMIMCSFRVHSKTIAAFNNNLISECYHTARSMARDLHMIISIINTFSGNSSAIST